MVSFAGGAGVTVAGNATNWPKTDGGPDQCTDVAVAIGPPVHAVGRRRPLRWPGPRSATAVAASRRSGAASRCSWPVWLGVVVVIVIEVVVAVSSCCAAAVQEQECRVLAGVGRAFEQGDRDGRSVGRLSGRNDQRGRERDRVQTVECRQAADNRKVGSRAAAVRRAAEDGDGVDADRFVKWVMYPERQRRRTTRIEASHVGADHEDLVAVGVSLFIE